MIFSLLKQTSSWKVFISLLFVLQLSTRNQCRWFILRCKTWNNPNCVFFIFFETYYNISRCNSSLGYVSQARHLYTFVFLIDFLITLFLLSCVAKNAFKRSLIQNSFHTSLSRILFISRCTNSSTPKTAKSCRGNCFGIHFCHPTCRGCHCQKLWRQTNCTISRGVSLYASAACSTIHQDFW